MPDEKLKPNSPYLIETSRLGLREFDPADAENFYELNNDPEVIRYTGDGAFDSIDEARQFLEAYDQYAKYGFGRWAVIEKSTGTYLGWCGLKKHNDGTVDLGFRFFRKFWNKGYATESARACLEYGFQTLGLHEIIGRVASQNRASVRVLEKLGMQFVGTGDCKGIPNSRFYRITRDQFHNKL